MIIIKQLFNKQNINLPTATAAPLNLKGFLNSHAGVMLSIKDEEIVD